MLKYQPCQNKIQKARKRDSVFCWTCGHYALSIDNRCACCFGVITRPKKHNKILDVKIKIDNIIQNETDPEFRFYVNGWVCWIKKSDLEEYQKLSDIEKHDRYYHFIKSLIESDKIARVIN
jgi:hypothetical protein